MKPKTKTKTTNPALKRKPKSKAKKPAPWSQERADAYSQGFDDAIALTKCVFERERLSAEKRLTKPVSTYWDLSALVIDFLYDEFWSKFMEVLFDVEDLAAGDVRSPSRSRILRKFVTPSLFERLKLVHRAHSS
jgi:hypothetical protein